MTSLPMRSPVLYAANRWLTNSCCNWLISTRSRKAYTVLVTFNTVRMVAARQEQLDSRRGSVGDCGSLSSALEIGEDTSRREVLWRREMLSFVSTERGIRAT